MKKILLVFIACLIASTAFAAEKVNIKAKELKLHNANGNKADTFFEDLDNSNNSKLFQPVIHKSSYMVNPAKTDFGSGLGLTIITMNNRDKGGQGILIPFNIDNQTNNENINTFLNDLADFLESDEEQITSAAIGSIIVMNYSDKECSPQNTKMEQITIRRILKINNIIQIGQIKPLLRSVCGNIKKDDMFEKFDPMNLLRMRAKMAEIYGE